MDITEEEKAKIREKVEALKNSRFKQQTLPAWRPIPSFRSTMITFTVFGLIFLALGIVLYIMSDQIQEVTLEYDNLSNCSTIGKNCTVQLDIPWDIKAPIYVYYQLDNFYQNHRRYVKSRSFDQLKGTYLGVGDLSDCDPIKTVKDLGDNITSVSKHNLSLSDPAIPCGLVAKSFFNDRYWLNVSVNTPIEINEKNIAWDSDKSYKFHNIINVPKDKGTTWQDIQWLDMENGMSYYYLIQKCRTLHCVDEDCGTA